MKIVIFGWVEFPYISPAASRLRILSKGWIESGAQVHLITTAQLQTVSELDKSKDSVLSSPNFTFESSYNKNEGYLFLPGKLNKLIKHINSIVESWKIMYSLMNKGECNLVYFWGWSAIGCYAVMKMAQKFQIPYFFDICEWFPASNFKFGIFNPMYWDDFLGRKMPDKNCSGVIAITKLIAKKYNRGYFPVQVVPAINDFSLDNSSHKVQSNSSIEKITFRVLYSGFSKYGDGVEYMFEAIEQVKKNGVPIELIIIGSDGKSGPSLGFANYCKDNEILKDIVEFRGRIPEEIYFSTLCSVDVLILPRRNCETNLAAFPTRLPEFLTTGRPVITTDVPDVPDYIENNIHAKVVLANNSKAIEKALMELWLNPELRKSIGLAGKIRGKEIFDYRGYTPQMYHLFKQAISI